MRLATGAPRRRSAPWKVIGSPRSSRKRAVASTSRRCAACCRRPLPRGGRRSGLLDPGDACAIQRPDIQLADLVEQRRHDISPPELHGEPRSGKQASATARRLAELGGASQRGYRDSDRAPPSCPCSRLFKFKRDVLMLAGDERGAVPSAPVRLVVKHIRQRLMDTTTFRLA